MLKKIKIREILGVKVYAVLGNGMIIRGLVFGCLETVWEEREALEKVKQLVLPKKPYDFFSKVGPFFSKTSCFTFASHNPLIKTGVFKEKSYSSEKLMV